MAEQTHESPMKRELMKRWRERVTAGHGPFAAGPETSNAVIANWIVDIVVDALDLRNTVPTSTYECPPCPIESALTEDNDD